MTDYEYILMQANRPLRGSVFNTLFKDKVGKREERIKNLSTVELIAENY